MRSQSNVKGIVFKLRNKKTRLEYITESDDGNEQGRDHRGLMVNSLLNYIAKARRPSKHPIYNDLNIYLDLNNPANLNKETCVFLDDIFANYDVETWLMESTTEMHAHAIFNTMYANRADNEQMYNLKINERRNTMLGNVALETNKK